MGSALLNALLNAATKNPDLVEKLIVGLFQLLVVEVEKKLAAARASA